MTLKEQMMKLQTYKMHEGEDTVYVERDDVLKALERQPCYNPDEWCKTCKEYNHDKHCCPRYNKVIRNAVEEMKQPKVGHWIEVEKYSDGKHKIKCSECGSHIFDRGHANSYVVKEKYKYCPRCGAKMIEPQESENVVVTHKNLCDSCTTEGCIFQSGIVRNHCDFYKAESEKT